MKKSFIQKFQINGLFGYKNLSFDFSNPIKILIGENGFGKTTILNTLYWVLTSDYQNLLRVKFNSINVEFDENHNYSFTKEQVKKCHQIQQNRNNIDPSLVDFIKRNMDPSLLKKLVDSISAPNGQNEFVRIINQNSEIKVGLPVDLVHQVVIHLSNTELCKPLIELDTYVKSTGFKILYYPTYRRIEEDLKNILKVDNSPQRILSPSNRENLFQNNSIIKFGMTDVEERVNKMLQQISSSSLSGFAEVSGSMIGKLLENKKDELHDFNYEEIEIVLSRVGENISQAEKNTILQEIKVDKTLSQKNQYLRYFLNQLLAVYNKQKTYDIAIKEFVKVCNNYLTDKEFVYNESTVSLKIFRKTDSKKLEPIELKQLSSGEKQIVSIFSQLYLELDKKFIILFDEPELSLSIFWQEKLLPDMLASNRCEFMLAVTHSPFIYNNDLKDNTVGIKEFEKWNK